MRKLFLICILYFGSFAVAHAQSFYYLLDAEIEYTLNTLLSPLLPYKGLTANDVKLRVVVDPTVNAFATPDNYIFVNSGLILKATSPQEIQGVLAHELGHLVGKHYAERRAQAPQFGVGTVAGIALGLGAAVAGSPDAAVGLVYGGLAATQAQALAFSRSQEREADQLAINMLKQAGTSPQGLQSFFRKLRTQELLYTRDIPPYLRSHPVTNDRIAALSTLSSASTNSAPSPLTDQQFKLFQAKVFALTHTPVQTQRHYPNNTLDAQYAHAIATALDGKYTQSINTLRNMQKDVPSPIFITDTLSQILYDAAAYENSLTLAKKVLHYFQNQHTPIPPIVYYRLGEIYMAQKQYNMAIPYFEQTRALLPEWLTATDMLGRALAAAHKPAESRIILAKKSLQQGDTATARLHLNAANAISSTLSPAYRQRFVQIQTFIEEKE